MTVLESLLSFSMVTYHAVLTRANQHRLQTPSKSDSHIHIYRSYNYCIGNSTSFLADLQRNDIMDKIHANLYVWNHRNNYCKLSWISSFSFNTRHLAFWFANKWHLRIALVKTSSVQYKNVMKSCASIISPIQKLPKPALPLQHKTESYSRYL